MGNTGTHRSPCRDDHIPGKIPGGLCQACSQLLTSPGRHFGTTLLLCLLQSSCSDNRDALHHETGAAAAPLPAPEVNGEHLGKVYLKPLVCIKGLRESLDYF